MANSRDLAKCPFCGSSETEMYFRGVIENSRLGESQSGYVECLQCWAQGPIIEVTGDEVYSNMLPEKMCEAWNRRAL